MGNAFYLKAKVESLVKQEAIIGANYCADPMLETIKIQEVYQVLMN